MEIILRNEKSQCIADCTVRYAKEMTAGEAQLLGKNILVGTADLEDDAYESVLSAGLKSAFSLALSQGYKNVLIDVSSFVPDVDADYFVSAASNAAEEWGETGSSLTVELLRGFDPNEELLKRVDAAVRAPVKETKTQSFGDIGDPLQQEFESYMKKNPAQVPFRRYLLELIEKGGYHKYSEVYKRAGISKSTFSRIINFAHDYMPSKSTVAALAIGLRLDPKETQKFFHAAGYHLGTSELQDRVVRFFIETGNYSVREVNYCLYYYGAPLLGEHARETREE